MKVLRWILAIVAILFTLLMAASTPLAWLALVVLTFGLYQSAQKRKGKMTFSKPGWFIAIGLLLPIVGVIVAPSETYETNMKVASEQTEKEEKEEKEKEKAEAEAKAKAEEKEKAEKKAEEEKKLAEEKAKKQEEEQAKKEAAEKKRQNLVGQFGLEEVMVARAVDGDTLELEDGRKIRLVGVNTPESTTRTEEYGKEASQYTATELEGKKVWVQKDVSDIDRYDRYLRIVWLDVPQDDMDEEEIRTKMFNAQLVLNGYAEPSTYSPDVKYSDFFVKFAREAREDNTGLWAFGENGTTKGDLDPKEEKKTTTASTNSSSSSSTTPAEPEAAPAATAQPEYFQNCTELRKKYPNGVASDHPAYASKHDRDKDNYACER
ncbi:thermonuclease family protein [Rossellomorea aquimaris]|uniref:thermonuclease family protein n=1 Tax=Rossellomorea aquimaris TaxID=189382 RepID=UPI0005CB4050|nr:thermonuclease family protein [Rossellomorea aquimaris]